MDRVASLLHKSQKISTAKKQRSNIVYDSLLIDGTKDCYVSRDENNNLMFAIALGETQPELGLPSIVLEHLEIVPSSYCRLSHKGSEDSKLFFRVTIKTIDQTLTKLFVRVFLAILEDLPSPRSRLEVQAQVNQLIELFKQLEKPPKKALHGVWGELFLIQQSDSLDHAVRYWHGDPFEKFDFQVNNYALEVKCSVKDIRKHRFSLEQLVPNAGVSKILIASILTEQSDSGQTVSELADSIRDRLTESKLSLKLDRVLYATLGRNWERADVVKFDAQKATRTLKFYDADKVPCVHKDIPQGVSNVSFESVLELLPSVSQFDSSSNPFSNLFLK